MQHDILVCGYSVAKPGDPVSRGPGGQTTYAPAVGLSVLSTRPEGPTLADYLPDGWVVSAEYEGPSPHRCKVTIELPDGVRNGQYNIGTASLDGLHHISHKSTDGMGQAVYVLLPGSGMVDQIDTQTVWGAVKDGVYLSVPTPDGGREVVQVPVVSVSNIF